MTTSVEERGATRLALPKKKARGFASGLEVLRALRLPQTEEGRAAQRFVRALLKTTDDIDLVIASLDRLRGCVNLALEVVDPVEAEARQMRADKAALLVQWEQVEAERGLDADLPGRLRDYCQDMGGVLAFNHKYAIGWLLESGACPTDVSEYLFKEDKEEGA